MLSCCFMNRSFCCCCCCCFVFYVQRCHLEQHKAHEHGKQKLLSVKTWLCVLDGLHPLIWAQQKFPSIGRLIVRLSAYPSSPPSARLLPRLPPSILPPSCPRPHWSAVPWLLPADQSAWCLLCLGEVNKLLGQSNGKRGARWANAWPLNASQTRTEGWESERGGYGGVREKRDETGGLGGKLKRKRAAKWHSSQQDQRNSSQ